MHTDAKTDRPEMWPMRTAHTLRLLPLSVNLRVDPRKVTARSLSLLAGMY